MVFDQLLSSYTKLKRYLGVFINVQYFLNSYSILGDLLLKKKFLIIEDGFQDKSILIQSIKYPITI